MIEKNLINADWCPKCGGPPFGIMYTDSFLVCCDECGFLVEANREDKALEKWNNYESELKVGD